MPELRWTLLIVGGLFILALAVWEIRRQRQAPRQSGLASGPPPSERMSPSLEGNAPAGRETVGFADAGRVRNEPIITLPELQPVDPRGEPRLTGRREPTHDPPIVEVDDASFARLQEGVAGATDAGSAHDEDTIVTTTDDDVSDDDIEPAIAAARRELSEPGDFSDWGESAAAAGSDSTALDHGDVRAGASSAGAAHSWTSASTSKTPSFGASASVSANGSMPDAAADGTDREHPSDSVGFAAEGDEPGVQSTTESRAVGATGGAPIVDWPSEGSRKIVALRLVSHPAARFQGRAVRQALAAEGFVLGKFDIFHKAGPDDRAILSAASLTKPGTFAMNTIDGQRFGGISLFAVLPGPLPPQETFDELLHTARALNDRLQGALQDERGEPLTPMRSASIRQSLSEGNGSTGPGASPEPQPETRQ